MSLPASGVVTFAIAPHFRPIEDRLDPAAHPACRFRLRGPDRLQDFEHKRRVDGLYWEGAYHRAGIGGKRVRPLVRVFGILPAGLVGGDVRLGRLSEGDRLGGIETRTHARLALCFERVRSLISEALRVQRLRACGLEAKERQGSQSHVARAAVELIAQDPGGAAVLHLQVKPAAIGMHPGLLSEPLQLQRH